VYWSPSSFSSPPPQSVKRRRSARHVSGEGVWLRIWRSIGKKSWVGIVFKGRLLRVGGGFSLDGVSLDGVSLDGVLCFCALA
jgi:hypothetical protein